MDRHLLGLAYLSPSPVGSKIVGVLTILNHGQFLGDADVDLRAWRCRIAAPYDSDCREIKAFAVAGRWTAWRWRGSAQQRRECSTLMRTARGEQH